MTKCPLSHHLIKADQLDQWIKDQMAIIVDKCLHASERSDNGYAQQWFR